MILSNITVPLLGLVDTAVIGHLSHAYYLGGVALGSTIITLILWLLGFLRMSTTGLVAQAYGAGDSKAQVSLLAQGGLFAILLGSAIILLQSPILSTAISFSDASAEVLHYCSEYFQIRVWSTPFALLNLVLLGWLLGRQKPKAAMWQLIFANLANISLDILLVLVLDWGVQGVAVASVIADLTGLSVALFMVNNELKQQSGFSYRKLLEEIHFDGVGRLVKLNFDIFIRSLCLQATFTFMTFKGASLGDNTIAANAVLLNLLLLISYALDGIAYYAEAEVGKACGENNNTRLKESVSLAWYWSAISAIFFVVAFGLFGGQVIQMLTGIEAVQEEARRYLPWVIFLPLLAFGSYLFDGVYIGAAKGKVMRNSMLFASLGIFFPSYLLLASWGNHALWAAMAIFMLARSLSLGLHYRFIGVK